MPRDLRNNIVSNYFPSLFRSEPDPDTIGQGDLGGETLAKFRRDHLKSSETVWLLARVAICWPMSTNSSGDRHCHLEESENYVDGY